MATAATLATIKPLFTCADADRAHAEWGCNCGPSALAAVCAQSLDDARLVLPGFDAKRYTNPSMMLAGLRALQADGRISGFDFKILSARQQTFEWPQFGLARVQWEGPWTDPGVPMAARYRYTHWIGVQKHPTKGDIAIFDVNAMVYGGVVSREYLVPWLLKECQPRANGRWHLTHAIEVRR